MITTANVTTTASEIVAPFYSRKLLAVQAPADTDIYIKIDASSDEVTTANGLKITAGDIFILTCQPGEFVNAVRAIHGGSGTKVARIQQE